jgi:hypothetical protein
MDNIIQYTIYGDDANDAKNDDGTYGHGCTKYH